MIIKTLENTTMKIPSVGMSTEIKTTYSAGGMSMAHKNDNQKMLLRIMDIHGLSISDIADLALVRKRTVYAWLRQENNTTSRHVSDQVLELIKLKINLLPESRNND